MDNTINYIMIEGRHGREVHRYTDTEMAELFTPDQIKMLRDRLVVICNKHHGNAWVRELNVTACDMFAVASQWMDR